MVKKDSKQNDIDAKVENKSAISMAKNPVQHAWSYQAYKCEVSR